MTIETTLPTNNEAWGFWGTIARSEHATDTAAAWATASEAIARATTCSAEGVRDFLALRGDPPKGQADWHPHPDGLLYASETRLEPQWG